MASLTRRDAHPKIVKVADPVTEVRQVKHSYEAVFWRKGESSI